MCCLLCVNRNGWTSNYLTRNVATAYTCLSCPANPTVYTDFKSKVIYWKNIFLVIDWVWETITCSIFFETIIFQETPPAAIWHFQFVSVAYFPSHHLFCRCYSMVLWKWNNNNRGCCVRQACQAAMVGKHLRFVPVLLVHWPLYCPAQCQLIWDKEALSALVVGIPQLQVWSASTATCRLFQWSPVAQCQTNIGTCWCGTGSRFGELSQPAVFWEHFQHTWTMDGARWEPVLYYVTDVWSVHWGVAAFQVLFASYSFRLKYVTLMLTSSNTMQQMSTLSVAWVYL